MKACRTASVIATAALVATSAIAACRDAAIPEIPPVTSARPDAASVLGVIGVTTANANLEPDQTLADDASPGVLMAPLTAESPVKASFVDAPGKVDAPVCSRLLIAVAKGKVLALNETLAVGDVLVVTYSDPVALQGTGLVVVARRDLDSATCAAKRPPLDKKVVRANAAPKLDFAGGTMTARMDVASTAPSLSPDVYLGRLEGTAPVAEHIHATSWEIVAAVEANGTFVLDGTEARLAPRQIVMVPPGAKHAWKPEPGSKLVAIQMYSPPGPEQRFVALAAAEKDVKDAGARDAR